MKIENNRDQKSENPMDAHYGEDRSRWNRWQQFKNGPTFKNYERSQSKPGYWRSKSGSYKKEPSRPRNYSSQSSSYRRPSSSRGSFGGASSFRRTPSGRRSDGSFSEKNKDQSQEPRLKERVMNLEENVKVMLKNQKDMMEMIQKRHNVGFVNGEDEHDEIVVENIADVMFLKEVTRVEAMVLDTGCPKSLVGRNWLDRYLQKNELKMEELTTQKCSQKFRFGPSQVYTSKEMVVIPITVKEAHKTDVFKKTFIEVFVLDAENVPLLCGRNTMKMWEIDLKMSKTELSCKIMDEEIECLETNGGHLVIALHKDVFWSTDDAVYFMKKLDDVECVDAIRKIHEVTNHKSEANMLHAYRNAGKLTSKIRQSIKNVVDSCNICRKYKKSLGTPKVSLPKVVDFNQIVTLDLKQFGNKEVLWMICSFTRFCQGYVLKDKSAESVIEALNSAWNWRFGFPSQGFWMDNGTEFKNCDLNEYASKFGFTIKFGPTYSPWSNGLNERNHYSADVTVRKMMEVDKKMTLKTAVEMASWTHNTNTNVLGFDPLSLVTGKSVTFPGISHGNEATESMFDSEAVKKIMERHHEVTKKFREVEYSSKLHRASRQQNRSFNDVKYEENDLVFYQEKDKKAWHGPVKVFCHRERDVFLWAKGDLKKLASCKVQP